MAGIFAWFGSHFGYAAILLGRRRFQWNETGARLGAGFLVLASFGLSVWMIIRVAGMPDVDFDPESVGFQSAFLCFLALAASSRILHHYFAILAEDLGLPSLRHLEAYLKAIFLVSLIGIGTLALFRYGGVDWAVNEDEWILLK
ncbi:MAG: hypothetical protein AAF514_24565 [Verrucomicrobiota bacterium]